MHCACQSRVVHALGANLVTSNLGYAPEPRTREPIRGKPWPDASSVGRIALSPLREVDKTHGAERRVPAPRAGQRRCRQAVFARAFIAVVRTTRCGPPPPVARTPSPTPSGLYRRERTRSSAGEIPASGWAFLADANSSSLKLKSSAVNESASTSAAASQTRNQKSVGRQP